MKKAIKRLVCLIMAVTFSVSISACASGGNANSGKDPALQHYFAPVVKVSKSGLATWTDLEGAEKFIYKINDGAETETSEKQIQLALNDVIKVKCVGNGVTRADSRWSEPAKYVPAHSYAIDGNGAMTNTVNVYKPDGTVVMDSIKGTKPYGDVMTAGEEYIIEFDITVGPYHNALLLAGVENTVISDLTWSDKNFNERTGEKADTSDKFYEVLYNTAYDISYNLATIHRSTWSYSGEYFKDDNGVGLVTYGWYMKDTPVLNDNGVYNTSAEGFWTVEPNWCSTLYGAHFLSTKKQTKQQTEAGYKFVRFKIKYNEVHSNGVGCVAGGEQYDSLNGKEGFNLYAIVHQHEKMIFFNSDLVPEHEARNSSFATNDLGESANDVTVYDAASGEAIFADGKSGKTLEAGKKYIVELAVSGEQNGSVCFTGIQNALISNVTWSDKRYAERTGENAVADTLRVLELDQASHHLAADRPLFHRLWKTADGYTGNFKNDCILNGNGEIDTSVSANRSADNNRCLEFALKIWLGTKLTSAQANKQYFRMTVEWRSFDTIQVGHVVEDKTSANYGNLAGAFFNMFVYSPAGGRYLYLTSFAPQ